MKKKYTYLKEFLFNSNFKPNFIKESIFVDSLEDSDDISDTADLEDTQTDSSPGYKREIIRKLALRHASKILDDFFEQFENRFSQKLFKSKTSVEYDYSSDKIIINIFDYVFTNMLIQQLEQIEEFAKKYESHHGLDILFVLQERVYSIDTKYPYHIKFFKESPLKFSHVMLDIQSPIISIKFLNKHLSSKYDIMDCLRIFKDLNSKSLSFHFENCVFSQEAFAYTKDYIHSEIFINSIYFDNCNFASPLFDNSFNVDNQTPVFDSIDALHFTQCNIPKTLQFGDIVNLPNRIVQNANTKVYVHVMQIRSLGNLCNCQVSGVYKITLDNVHGLRKLQNIKDTEIDIVSYKYLKTDYATIDFESESLPKYIAKLINFSYYIPGYHNNPSSAIKESLNLFDFYDLNRKLLEREFKQLPINHSNQYLDNDEDFTDNPKFWEFVYKMFREDVLNV